MHLLPHALSFSILSVIMLTFNHINSDFYLACLVESMQMDYLKKSFPWDLLIALHRVSKVILKRPEFSIQVIIYWNGTGKKKKQPTTENLSSNKNLYWKYRIQLKSTQECTILEDIVHFLSKIMKSIRNPVEKSINPDVSLWESSRQSTVTFSKWNYKQRSKSNLSFTLLWNEEEHSLVL